MYTVRKPLTINGIRRKIGETLLESEVNEKRAGALVKSGYLVCQNVQLLEASAQDAAEALLPELLLPELISVPVLSSEYGEMYDVRSDSIVTALTYMQMGVAEAVEEIRKLQDEDTLILLHMCDSRQGIKKAAKERAQQVHEIMAMEELNKDEAGDD